VDNLWALAGLPITNGLRAKFLAEPGPGPALQVSRLVYFLNFESEADAPENTLHYNTCKPRPGRAGDACSCHGHGMSVLVRVSAGETPSGRPTGPKSVTVSDSHI
jgi:hypothetical protein